MGALAIWFRSPASEWLEALPVGNGLLGAMVFDGVDLERLQVNEKTLWSGCPLDLERPDAWRYVRRARELLFEGRYCEAEELVRKHVMVHPPREGGDTLHSYQMLCDVFIELGRAGAASGYRRGLDLREAIAWVEYEQGGALHRREVFASFADKALVIRLSSIGQEGWPFSVRLERRNAEVTAEGDALVLRGRARCPCHGEGVEYAAALKALAEGGVVEAERGRLKVKGARKHIVKPV